MLSAVRRSTRGVGLASWLASPASGAALVAIAAAVALAVAGCRFGSATPRIVYVTPTPGSSSTPTAMATATPAPTPVASPTPTPVPVAPTVAADKITDAGDTGTCGHWKIAISKPVVSGWPADAAAAVNEAIAAAIQSRVDAFKASVAAGGGGAGACTLDGQYSVALASTSLLSLRLTMTEYLGGAGSSTSAGSLNFSSAGATISLADLFTDPTAAAAKLSTESRARLLALLGPDGVDASWIDPGTTASLSNFDKAWVFTTGGLELTFQELQVAPHAEGTPRIVIPWASLSGIVRPDGPAGQFVA